MLTVCLNVLLLPKVLKIPDYEEDSFEYRYCQVLLYGDVQSLDELTEEFVNRACNEVDITGELVLKSRKRYYFIDILK